MAEKLTLVDSDVLVGILRKEEIPFQNAQSYLEKFGQFNISCLTWYECYRGYQVIAATQRMKEFSRLMAVTNIMDLEKSILAKASEIYGKLYKMGKLTGEFDLLIGTTAIINGWKLATNNEKHFQVLADEFGLEIENWIASPIL